MQKTETKSVDTTVVVTLPLDNQFAQQLKQLEPEQRTEVIMELTRYFDFSAGFKPEVRAYRTIMEGIIEVTLGGKQKWEDWRDEMHTLHCTVLMYRKINQMLGVKNES